MSAITPDSSIIAQMKTRLSNAADRLDRNEDGKLSLEEMKGTQLTAPADVRAISRLHKLAGADNEVPVAQVKAFANLYMDTFERSVDENGRVDDKTWYRWSHHDLPLETFVRLADEIRAQKAGE